MPSPCGAVHVIAPVWWTVARTVAAPNLHLASPGEHADTFALSGNGRAGECWASGVRTEVLESSADHKHGDVPRNVTTLGTDLDHRHATPQVCRSSIRASWSRRQLKDGLVVIINASVKRLVGRKGIRSTGCAAEGWRRGWRGRVSPTHSHFNPWWFSMRIGRRTYRKTFLYPLMYTL